MTPLPARSLSKALLESFNTRVRLTIHMTCRWQGAASSADLGGRASDWAEDDDAGGDEGGRRELCARCMRHVMSSRCMCWAVLSSSSSSSSRRWPWPDASQISNQIKSYTGLRLPSSSRPPVGDSSDHSLRVRTEQCWAASAWKITARAQLCDALPCHRCIHATPCHAMRCDAMRHTRPASSASRPGPREL